MEMLGGGGEIKESCRTVDIMSDAAYVILTRNSREFTGNFAIDDEVLESAGVTDMEQYACVPGLLAWIPSFLSLNLVIFI